MGKRWRLWGILAAAATLSIVVVVVLWVVRPSRLPDDTLFVPADVPSLQQALEQASPGATISVRASDDPIHGPILVTVPDITILSSSGRVRMIGTGETPVLSIRADGVEVRGFDISSGTVGVRIDAADCTISNVHITSAPIGIQLSNASRCVLQSIEMSGGRVGVELVNSNGVTIEALTASGFSGSGVRLLGSRNNLLKDLWLSDNAVGISIEQASTNNTIEACSIDASSDVGIAVRGSNDNLLSDIAVDFARIGIVLEEVTGVEVRGCDIRTPTAAGILLQNAVQNRILETVVEGGEGAGIQLAQSAENALIGNNVFSCVGEGISVIRGGRNLLMGNEIQGCLIGVQIEESTGARVLRNRVSSSELGGFLVSMGGSHQLLDNVATGGAYGMVLTESGGNTVLRNAIEGADRAGLLLARTNEDNHVADNDARACAWGLLLFASTRDLITYNRFVDNGIGVLLAQLSSGTRIEGNIISGNGIGLRQQSDLAGVEDDLERLRIASSPSDESGFPLLTNNVFGNNSSFDIQNQSAEELLAAGNWWGTASVRDPGGAVVSNGVSLEQSGWKGTITVGTASDDVRVLLGRILQLTLAETGFRVIDLVGMGASERVHQALLAADVDLILCSDTVSESAGLMETGQSVSLPTRAYEGWRIVVSSQLADRLADFTVSGLASWQTDSGELLRYATTSAFSEEEFDAFLTASELVGSARSFTQANALEEAEALLKFGAVDVVIVGSLEETLTLSGFLAIEDDVQALKQDLILMIARQSIVLQYPEVEDILTMLGERLTSDVLHDLVSRIRSLHQEPDDVAREFLRRE